MRSWAALLLLAATVARAQEVLIDFDDRAAPECAFSNAEHLGDQYLARGVRFLPPPEGPTGAIVEQPCFDRVSGHSPPNIVAWVPGLAATPLLMDFTEPVERVSIRATNWNRVDTIELLAYDATDALVASDSISTLGLVGPLQDLSVAGPGVVRASLTSLSDEIAIDDLRYLHEISLPPEFVLYESALASDVLDPANQVASSPTSPIEHAAPSAPRLFYLVDDGAGLPAVMRLERGGPGLRVLF